MPAQHERARSGAHTVLLAGARTEVSRPHRPARGPPVRCSLTPARASFLLAARAGTERRCVPQPRGKARARRQAAGRSLAWPVGEDVPLKRVDAHRLPAVDLPHRRWLDAGVGRNPEQLHRLRRRHARCGLVGRRAARAGALGAPGREHPAHTGASGGGGRRRGSGSRTRTPPSLFIMMSEKPPLALAGVSHSAAAASTMAASVARTGCAREVIIRKSSVRVNSQPCVNCIYR